MSDPHSPAQCRRRAMDALARREQCRFELEGRLAKAGFEPDIIVDTLDQLEAENLLSDSRFAEAWVSSRHRQGKGPQRIRAELRERRFVDADIEAALATAALDWNALASAVRRRKFGSVGPPDYVERARQMRFLAYRGFSQDQIEFAMADAAPVE